MRKDNAVVFKGTKEGITVLLSPEEDFSVIKEELKKKVEGAAGFFDGVKTSIALRGKALSEEEETELIRIIADKSNMNVTFVRDSAEKDKGHAAVLINKVMKDCTLTKFHNGSVRSGQSIEFQGSIVIMGDVNPGALIRAQGSIIVLGQLKGVAHAGYKGDSSAFVVALSMTPVQLRIADKITVFPEDSQRGKRLVEMAYIENGQICVRSLN